MGYRYLNTGTAVPVFAAEPPLATEGSLYYNSTSDIFYICNGTQWNLVSNASPTATGGTVTIDALSEGGTFSYDLGDDFTDDVDTDAQLTYALVSGTLPSGCTLPTTGNSEFTGTASGVSSNTNYTWTIKATDTSGGTATQDYQQTINTVAPTVTGGTVTISAVDEGSSASYDVDTNFTFTAGSTFSAYSLLSGSLPSGLSFNTSTGVISGTMGTVSSDTAYSFTIRATDTDGDTADQAYSWTITNVPLSATGGTITTYSGYRSHTFTSSASGASGFVPNTSGTVEYLIIAGGGRGGNYAGGAGAGGMLTGSVSVTAQQYAITIGAGGSSANGSNSAALGVTTAIGGGAGGNNGGVGNSGGSGGGGGYNNSVGGSGTSGQGSNGGQGYTGSGHIYMSGGGGGAGAAGGNATASPRKSGNGGNGLQNNYRTGSNIYYAGGGGGGSPSGSPYVSGQGQGSGGLGGGGGGTTGGVTPIPGAINTGSGGGGSGAAPSYDGGNGGSGIVVIRYAV